MVGVTLGMRPEHLQVVESEGESTRHTVQVIEHLGADTLTGTSAPVAPS